MYLSNKKALITGVSRGLGLELTRQLLARGVTVVGWGRSAPELTHEQFHFQPLDITQPEDVETALQDTLARVGEIDFLINNAGFGRFAKVDELPIDTWREMMSVNLDAMFFVTRAWVPHLKTRGSAHIVNLSSIAGRVGMPQGEGYNASKFAVSGFSECLFHELRPFGIKVSTIYPGSISTNFFDEIPGIDAHDGMMRPQDVAHTIVQLLDTHPNYLVREIEMRPLKKG